MREPGAVLTTISAFLELEDDADFIERAPALVHGAPRPRFGDLDPEDQDELREACRPGQVLLDRAE